MRDEEPDVTDDEPIALPVGLDLARASWWDTPDPAGEARLMDAIGRPQGAARPALLARSARRIALAGLAVAAAAAALVFAGYQWGDRQPPSRGTGFALAATALQPDAAAVG